MKKNSLIWLFKKKESLVNKGFGVLNNGKRIFLDCS